VPRFRPLILLPLVLAAVVLPGAARPANPVLTATVGPGFTITLKNASGTQVDRIGPGTYTINVNDMSAEHSFHLTGPGGVDMATDIAGTGKATWTVTLVDGKYSYLCDAHPTTMRKAFTVGAPLPTLTGKVGPGKTIALRNAGGALVKSVAAGTYKVTINDASKADNFHLLGGGLNKKTGVKFRGKTVWTITLKAGKTYTIRSDAHAKVKRTFKAIAKLPPPPPPPGP